MKGGSELRPQATWPCPPPSRPLPERQVLRLPSARLHGPFASPRGAHHRPRVVTSLRLGGAGPGIGMMGTGRPWGCRADRVAPRLQGQAHRWVGAVVSPPGTVLTIPIRRLSESHTSTINTPTARLVSGPRRVYIGVTPESGRRRIGKGSGENQGAWRRAGRRRPQERGGPQATALGVAPTVRRPSPQASVPSRGPTGRASCQDTHGRRPEPPEPARGHVGTQARLPGAGDSRLTGSSWNGEN